MTKVDQVLERLREGDAPVDELTAIGKSFPVMLSALRKRGHEIKTKLTDEGTVYSLVHDAGDTAGGGPSKAKQVVPPHEHIWLSTGQCSTDGCGAKQEGYMPKPKPVAPPTKSPTPAPTSERKSYSVVVPVTLRVKVDIELEE